MSSDRGRFDVYTVAVLRRPDDALEMSEEQLDELQRQHVAYRDEQTDESLRGMAIFACDPDEASRLSDSDPSVIACRLTYDVMEWWTAAETLAFPRADRPVGDRRSMPED